MVKVNTPLMSLHATGRFSGLLVFGKSSRRTTVYIQKKRSKNRFFSQKWGTGYGLGQFGVCFFGDISFVGVGRVDSSNSFIFLNPSFSQMSKRILYSDAVAMWNSLSDVLQNQYVARAGVLSLTGFNLFISEYLLSF